MDFGKFGSFLMQALKNNPISNWLNSSTTYASDLKQPSQQPVYAPPAPSTAPQGFGNRLISDASVKAGLSKFGNAPIATMSSQLAKAGQSLPANVDPYLPTVLSLMETGGGAHQTAKNNPFNIRGYYDDPAKTQFIDYQSPNDAVLGGGPYNSKGFVGLVNKDPAYADFRQSGNLDDFFNHYTPPGPKFGNPNLQELKDRYNKLRGLF